MVLCFLVECTMELSARIRVPCKAFGMVEESELPTITDLVNVSSYS